MNVQPTERRQQVRLASRFMYVCSAYPRGLTPRAYQQLIMRRPHLRTIGWVLKRGRARDVLRPARRQSMGARIEVAAWPLELTTA
jgi:hypothetical protein